MKISINKTELLAPLQHVSAATGKALLSNFLLIGRKGQIEIIGTDNETEIKAVIPADVDGAGSIQLPAKKLFDICRALGDDAKLNFTIEGESATVKTGKSKFKLATLPADDFPVFDEPEDVTDVIVTSGDLQVAIKRCSFAMGNRDVRFYLNGMHVNVKNGVLTAVATDGHRLATHTADVTVEGDDISAIVPREAIGDISKMITDPAADLTLHFSSRFMRVSSGYLTLTTRLIDGKFPDYEKVIPTPSGNIATIDREPMQRSLVRSSILANEMYKGVRLVFNENHLAIETNNPKGESAEDEMQIEYNGEPIEAGFNVVYLLDVINAMETDSFDIDIQGATSSILVKPHNTSNSLFVVMPMRL